MSDARIRFKAPLNPLACVEYVFDFNDQEFTDPGKVPFLEDEETVEDLTLLVMAPAVAMGLEIREDGAFGVTELLPGEFAAYLRIKEGMQQDPRFRNGVVLEILALVTTSSTPPRKKPATFEIVVKS